MLLSTPAMEVTRLQKANGGSGGGGITLEELKRAAAPAKRSDER